MFRNVFFCVWAALLTRATSAFKIYHQTSTHASPMFSTRTDYFSSSSSISGLSTRRAASTRIDATATIGLDDSNRELLNSKTPVLVDAYANFCGPCRLIEPIIKSVVNKWEGKVVLAKYDVESKEIMEIKTDMLMQDVVITKLPSLVLYQEGKVLANRSGLINEKELNEFLEKHVKLVDDSAKKIGDPDVAPSKSGRISFGSSFERDDYAL